MERNLVYLYAFDGMADWEIGYLCAELESGRYLRRPGFYEVRAFSMGREPVRTMGGLRVLPQVGAEWVDERRAALLVLPGGDSWMDPGSHGEALTLAGRFLAAGVPAAGICGATFGLARAGLLDERAHTSNAPGLLEIFSPSYRGAALYRDEGAVADGGLVTASGLAPLDFARECLRLLDAMDAEVLDAWWDLNRERSFSAYARLMAAAPQRAA